MKNARIRTLAYSLLSAATLSLASNVRAQVADQPPEAPEAPEPPEAPQPLKALPVPRQLAIADRVVVLDASSDDDDDELPGERRKEVVIKRRGGDGIIRIEERNEDGDVI